MEVLTLWPLCTTEISGKGNNVIDAVFSRTLPMKERSKSGINLMQAILSGGFPEPLQRTGRRRRAWFDSYLTTLIDRDIRSIAQIQDLYAVPRLLKLLAGRTAALHNLSEVSRTAGIPNTTLARYMTLLKTLFLIQELPAWSSNLGKRLVKSPKLYAVDTGLACHLLDIDEKQLQKKGELAGRLFENFVVLEFFKHTAWSDAFVELFHFRSQTGQEVDLVIEKGDEIVGIKIKFSATPSPKDFTGLKLLKKHLGKKFIRGILIHTGRETIPFDEDLHAVPVSTLFPIHTG
jgi:predicted AAA+ superfamily ATPase